MAAEFDPYYTWLGISPAEQPADYYRLLGVRQFEGNADAIQNAMDQRMHFLRTLQVGKRGALSQSLLNEISAAAGCLLNAEQKAAYDQRLRGERAQREAARVVPAAAAAVPVVSVLSAVAMPAIADTRLVRKGEWNWFDLRSSEGLALAFLIGLPLLGVVGMGVVRLMSADEEPAVAAVPTSGTTNPLELPPAPQPNDPIKPPLTVSVAPAVASQSPVEASVVAPSPPEPVLGPTAELPVSADSPPSSVAAESINLLKPADGKFRVLRGGISHGSGEVRTQPQSTAFAVPVRYPAEYAIEADVVRLTGKNSLCIGFLVGGRPLTAVVDGFDSQRSGLTCIGGFEIFSHESPFARNGALLTNGVESTVRIEVTRHSVDLVVDDQPISHWNIDTQLPIRAAQGMSWMEAEAVCVYTWDASYRFTRLELLPLTKDE